MIGFLTGGGEAVAIVLWVVGALVVGVLLAMVASWVSRRKRHVGLRRAH